MRIRAPPGREESMERTKDFYNGMNYAKKQLQQREHERRRRKRYFIKQKLCGIATFAVLVIATPFAPLLDLDIITISAFFMPIALSFTFSRKNVSNMYIRSQDREKLYRLGGNYACVEYGSVTKRAKKGQEPKETHRIFISDGVLEEIGTYETKERCLEIIDEIQKVSVSYLYSAGSPGFLKGAPAFPPFATEIPRIYEMPEK